MMSLTFCVYAAFLGPQIFRYDLRHDLVNADILKIYPLRGWQVLLGEILAPAAIIAGIQWVLLLAAALTIQGLGKGMVFGASLRIALAVGCALILPFVSSLILLMSNAATLLFPAWAPPGPRQGGGIEVLGQRMILFLGQIIVLAVAALPSAIIALFIFAFGPLFFGQTAALILAAIGATLPLLGEIAFFIWWLGERFEHFDLSAELPH
jgi:hypothetical protein